MYTRACIFHYFLIWVKLTYKDFRLYVRTTGHSGWFRTSSWLRQGSVLFPGLFTAVRWVLIVRGEKKRQKKNRICRHLFIWGKDAKEIEEKLNKWELIRRGIAGWKWVHGIWTHVTLQQQNGVARYWKTGRRLARNWKGKTGRIKRSETLAIDLYTDEMMLEEKLWAWVRITTTAQVSYTVRRLYLWPHWLHYFVL